MVNSLHVQASLNELVAGINKTVEAQPEFFDKVDVIVAPPMLHLAAVLKSIHPKVRAPPRAEGEGRK